jgi:DNA polymerase-3 subunit delta
MFYVFYGPDELSRTEALAEMKAQLGDPSIADLNIARLDGQSLSLGDLQQACGAIPFLSDRRLVIVTNYLTQLGRRGRGQAEKAALDALADYLTRLPDTLQLVFVEYEPRDEDARPRPPVVTKNHPILKLAQQHPECGQAREFALPGKGAELTEWIAQRARRKGASIERAAADALGVAVGPDSRLLDSELEKLVTYAGAERTTLTLADVELLVPYTGQSNIFTMVDAIGRRDGRAALPMLHKLLDEHPNKPEYCLSLLGMIVRQFRMLIQVKELDGQSLAPSTIAKRVELNPFVVDKVRLQARNFSMRQLEAIYAQLLATDLAIKTGQMDGVLALDTLVAALCQP